MSGGLKFDNTITLGDLVLAVTLTAGVIAFGESLRYQIDAVKQQQAQDEKQITALVQAQTDFQTSLEDEKQARMSYQNDNDKAVTEVQTIINDRLNLKP